jgi:Ca2+-binding RTX toxin-like protein
MRKHHGDSARTIDQVTAAPMFESLETRSLMSVSLANGVLTVTGTGGADRIEIQKRAAKGAIQVELNGSERRFALSSVSKVQIFAKGGSDFVEYSGRDGGLSTRAFVDAGDGNDTVQTGAGNDSILGGGGRDYLQGKGGNDSISGGAFQDRIEGGDGNDSLFGGSGNDRIYGGNGNDRLEGNDGEDDLHGGAGADSIFGGSGNDDFDNSDSLSELKDRNSGDNGANSLI